MTTHATKSDWAIVAKPVPGRRPGSVNDDDGQVFISSVGRLQLKRPIIEFLGNPKSVQLFVNKNKGLIGIKPCGADAPQAFTVSTTGKGGNSGHHVSAGSAAAIINPNWKKYAARYPYSFDRTRKTVVVDLSSIVAL